MPFRKRGGECLSFGGIRTKPSLSSCYRSTLRIVHVSMSSEYVRASERHFRNPSLGGSSRDFPIQDFLDFSIFHRRPQPLWHPIKDLL